MNPDQHSGPGPSQMSFPRPPTGDDCSAANGLDSPGVLVLTGRRGNELGLMVAWAADQISPHTCVGGGGRWWEALTAMLQLSEGLASAWDDGQPDPFDPSPGDTPSSVLAVVRETVCAAAAGPVFDAISLLQVGLLVDEAIDALTAAQAGPGDGRPCPGQVRG